MAAFPTWPCAFTVLIARISIVSARVGAPVIEHPMAQNFFTRAGVAGTGDVPINQRVSKMKKRTSEYGLKP
jgi:hypothetical protein